MLGFGAIEIEKATYSLGMCGSIEFQINETCQRYRVTIDMAYGMKVSEWVVDHWSQPEKMRLEEVVALLPPGRWSCESFIAAWAGFASGYEVGSCK
jgi:hypothetical protein